MPSSFFIWTRREGKIDLRKKEPKKNNDFVFLPRGDETADFTINGNSGKVKSLREVTNSKAEHYIKVKDGKDIEEVKERLDKTEFIFYSSVNGGVAWLSQKDIEEQYNERW